MTNGMSKKQVNLYDRHRNKRATVKKERAKAKHFGISEQVHLQQSVEMDYEKQNKPEVTHLGIVIESRGYIFHVMHEDKVIECKLNKELQFSLGQKIVVGDRVYFEPDNGTGWIKSLVPRRSFLARVRGDSTRFSAFSQAIQTIAANIDIALIVASVMNPRFTPSLIDRYLVICQNGNVNPVICLNKADLSRERHPILNWYRLHLGLEVIEASTVTGEGMERLRDCLHGKMSVLVGKSGVGKTSIINELIPGANLRTQPVGNKTGKGKHTTAISNLYRWDDESYIIDTPGVRSLGLEHIEKGSLKYYFPEFEEFEKYCKYTNCIHEHEPECGIKQAAVDGKIDKYRYESYLRILADASQ